MALRFIESFDHYTTTGAGFDAKWEAALHNGAPTPSSAAGRNGTKGIGPWTLNGYFGKQLTSQATWIVGAAFRLDSAIGTGSAALISAYDAGTSQSELYVSPARTLILTRGGTALATGTTILKTNVFYYLEWKVTIHNSTGIAECRIDGVPELTLSSQDTQVSANAYADIIRFSGTVNYGSISIDDIYICDGTGSAPTNTFLGDCRIEALMPTGNGNSSNFVGSDGNSTDNYLLIDEADPNSDTDYVESSSITNKDTYAFGNLTSTEGTVYGVQVLPDVKKTDSGSRGIACVARLSGTEINSANSTLDTGYHYHPGLFETKPGGGAWTVGDVNNAEFGVKVTV